MKFLKLKTTSWIAIAIAVVTLGAASTNVLAWGGVGDDIDGVCVSGACASTYCGMQDTDASALVGGMTELLGINQHDVMFLEPDGTSANNVRLSLTQGGVTAPAWATSPPIDIDQIDIECEG